MCVCRGGGQNYFSPRKDEMAQTSFHTMQTSTIYQNWGQPIKETICSLGANISFNSFTTKKQTTKFSSTNFQINLKSKPYRTNSMYWDR